MTVFRIQCALLLCVLLLGSIDYALADTSCQLNPPSISGCGDFSGMPAQVHGGQTVTVSVGPSGTGAPCVGNGRSIAINAANGKTWVVDGNPIQSTDISMSSIPLDANPHTVQVTMQGHFITGGPACNLGAFLGVPGVWTTAHYFELDPAITASFTANVTFKSGTGPGVNAGDTITYTATAENAVPVSSWVMASDIPPETTLVPGSITGDGVLSGRTITWTTTLGGYSVTVDPQLPGRTQVATGVFVTATLPNGDTAFAQASTQVPVQQPSLLLEITPTTRTPGEVEPGETYTYTLTLTVPSGATGITLQDAIPQNTTLVESSVTPAAELSGNVLTWTFPAGTTQATASFQVQLAQAGALPPGTQFVVDNANASATAGGRTLTTAETNQLRIKIGQITLSINPPPPPDSVAPGGSIDYTLNAAVTTTATTMKITDTIPPGTTLVDAHGGQVSGRTVTWTFRNTGAATAMLSVKVLDARHLPPGLTAIVDTGHVDATLPSGDVLSADATNTLPLGNITIVGTVRDVVMDFPNQVFIKLSTPLPGVQVELLSPDLKQRFSSAVTDKKGNYSLTAPEPGDYVIQATAGASRYDHGTNKIVPGGFPIVQRLPITVPTNPTGPVKAEDIHQPVSLVGAASGVLFQLNNTAVTITPVANLIPGAQLGTQAVHFDTAGAEAFVARVVGQSADTRFTAVFNGTQPRDSWNSLTRLVAAMKLLKVQVDEDDKLVDDVGKAIALVVCIDMTERLGKAFPKIFGDPKSLTVAELEVKLMTVGTLADGAGPWLPKLLEATSLSASDKAFWVDAAAKAIRFGSAALTHQFLSDALFEVAFVSLRRGILELMVDALIVNGPHGYQHVLDNSVALAERNVIASDTTQTLTALEGLSAQLVIAAEKAHSESVSALQIISLFRGAAGIYSLEQKLITASGVPVDTGTLGKILGFVTQYTKYPIAVTYGVAIGLPLSQVALRTAQVEPLVGQAFSGPVGGLAAMADPPASGLASAGAAGSLDSPDLRAAAALPAVQTYLAVLAQVKSAVTAGDAATYATLRASLAAAEQGLGDLLDPLYFRSLAALSPETSSQAAAAQAALENTRRRAAVTRAYLYMILEVWAAAPSATGASVALTAIDQTAKLVAAAGTAADQEMPFLTGIPIPGALVVSPGDNPLQVAAGDILELHYTVTNVGDAHLPAGTAELSFETDPGLISPAQQVIPALAPGASVDLVWLIQTAAGSPAFLDFQISASASGAHAAILQDGIAVVPPGG